MNTSDQTSEGTLVRRIATWAGFIIVIGLIIWGLVAAQQKSERTGAYTVKLPSEVTSADWITGSTTSAVTLVEYADFQCPACGFYKPLIDQLVKEEGSKFRLVYRHFPLPQHQNATSSAVATEAAGKQGKFWEMASIIFDHQSDWESLPNTDELFTSYATTLGLNIAQFTIDIKDPTLLKKINDSRDLAARAGVDSTPTFFLNGEKVANPQSYDAFKTLIETASK